jgi:peptide/nickel transport system substrate-binding protein
VKFSLERMASSEPEFLRSYQFEAMERVEIVDSATVRVTLRQPFAPFLTYVASEWSAIVAPEVVERFGNLKSFESLIGTGPYIRDRSEPDVVHVVKANPNYFRAGQPYIQEIRGLVVADAATRDANLRSKSLDISYWGGLPVDGLDDLKRSTKMVFQQWPGTWYYVDRLNLEKVPAFKDARVRKALHLAANRQASINAVFGGEGKLNGPVPWAFEDFALTQDELLQTPGYSQNKDADIAEAKRLLDAAGHSDLTFKILSTTGNREPEVRQADFQRIGVETEIEIVDTPGILSRMAQENFEFTAWLDNAFWDPDDYLYGNTHTDGSRNYQGYSNSDIDRMIEAQRGELDLAKRSEMVREVQRKIIDEAPYLSVGSINAWWAWWPYLKNRQLSGALNPYQYKDCWLDTSDETWHG